MILTTRKFFVGETIDDAIRAAGGRTNGFDYIRLVLSLAVVASHSINVTMGQKAVSEFFYSGWRPILILVLPSFFALSGFLVAGSLMRCRTLASFLYLRGIRLLPALAVEVFVSAIVIGSIFTTLPLKDYYLHPEFRAYFLNILGLIHFYLPGVFENNVMPGKVNSQLWTIPNELRCYVALSLCAIFRLHRKPKLFLIVVIFAEIINDASSLAFPRHSAEIVRGVGLVMSFFWGVVFYQFKEKILQSASITLFAAAFVLVLALLPGGENFIALPACIITVYVGTRNLPRNWFTVGSDYSYGIYLYGFPIQQTLVASWPYQMGWFENIVWSILIATSLAALSWRFIEKPALELRSKVSRIDKTVSESVFNKVLRIN
jgi:peptidoglycan/LPS O-acetylase OafA/YrhL